MFEEDETLKAGRFVQIPSSNHGKDGQVGKILSKWGNTIAVDFDGLLGHYTISKHTIIPIKIGEIYGMKVYADPSIPENEIHIKDKK